MTLTPHFSNEHLYLCKSPLIELSTRCTVLQCGAQCFVDYINSKVRHLHKFWPIWHGLQIWALMSSYSWNSIGSHGISTGICWRTEPSSSARHEMAVPQPVSPCPYTASPLDFGSSLSCSAMRPSIPFSTFSLRAISNIFFGVLLWCSSDGPAT